jgi:hypothetical protein
MVAPLSIEEASSNSGSASVRHRGGSHEQEEDLDEDLTALMNDGSLSKQPKRDAATLSSRQITICLSISFILVVIFVVVGGGKQGKQTTKSNCIALEPGSIRDSAMVLFVFNAAATLSL